jgi:hypothetical protein
LPHTTIVKLGAALGALAIAVPAAAATADDAAPSPGGLGYVDPAAPSVFADGSTLAAPLAQMLGGVVRVHGRLAGSHPGDGVELQRLDVVAGWVTATRATVGADGSFDAVWKADRSGATSLRAVPAGQQAAAATSATASTAPARGLTIFRPARATWYGPGFYGRRTACGRRLTTRLLGVAHRTLPCGTLVSLYNAGRTVTVPVIDRGPFRRGTSYDLTAATARALGMTETTTLGAIRATPATPVAAVAP